MKQFTNFNDVENLGSLISIAIKLKQNPFGFTTLGENKTLGLLFFNASLRTRMSTQKAAQNLGMNVIVMNLNNEGWSIELENGTVMNKGTQEHIKEAVGVIFSIVTLLVFELLLVSLIESLTIKKRF